MEKNEKENNLENQENDFGEQSGIKDKVKNLFYGVVKTVGMVYVGASVAIVAYLIPKEYYLVYKGYIEPDIEPYIRSAKAYVSELIEDTKVSANASEYESIVNAFMVANNEYVSLAQDSTAQDVDKTEYKGVLPIVEDETQTKNIADPYFSPISTIGPYEYESYSMLDGVETNGYTYKIIPGRYLRDYLNENNIPYCIIDGKIYTPVSTISHTQVMNYSTSASNIGTKEDNVYCEKINERGSSKSGIYYKTNIQYYNDGNRDWCKVTRSKLGGTVHHSASCHEKETSSYEDLKNVYIILRVPTNELTTEEAKTLTKKA